MCRKGFVVKVLMNPHAGQIKDATDGISRVVLEYFKHLPKFGVELVDPGAESYDLLVGHAGWETKPGVVHNHGLWWTADDTGWVQIDHLTSNRDVISALRNAREVTVPSAWVAENIARDMRFTPHVVPHGIDWDAWQHNKPNGGYILWNKNRMTDVCDPRPVTWVANRFPQYKFISTFAVEPPANIQVIGRVPHSEMKDLIQRASVYLNTTKETFGIGILEALASGVPVLSVARGGALDLVEHKVTGYLAQNWDDFSDGLDWILKHRDELGEAAMESVKHYTWESTCELVASIYEKALNVQPPTCTVVIPTYQYEGVVCRAIQSVMDQTFTDFECYIVDDGSTDDTGRVVKRFIKDDPRFHYIKQENAGVANARNNGIARGRGKYVCCLDADDAIKPEFLETCIDALEQENISIAYTGLWIVRADGYERPGDWPGPFDYNQQVNRQNQIPTCCVFTREMWERLGGYRQRYAPGGAGAEDAEFWLRAGAYGFDARQVTEENLFIYSFLTGNVSGDPRYREVDWLSWHPWTRDSQHPFASLALPENHFSHLVRQYDEPTVSVIIPVGPGHQGTLIDTLDSLEAQTWRKWEAIVINDTGKPLDLTAYPYVRLVETKGKTGAGFARNRGIEIARAKVFVCLDADDFLQPTFLATVLDAHQDNLDAWIYTDLYILHPNGHLEYYHCEEFDTDELWRNGVASVTCLYTKEMWEKCGGFDEDNNREDWDFHLRLAMAGYCGVKVPEALFTYRHATGARRIDGSIKQEAKRIREIYNQEDLRMACRSCGGRRRKTLTSSPPPIPANFVTKEELGWPMLEYVGGNQNTLTFTGNTGRRYRFGDNTHHKMHRVHPDDAAKLMRFNCFRETDARETDRTVLTAQAAPKAKPVITREKAPVITLEDMPKITDVAAEIDKLDVKSMTIKVLNNSNLTYDEWSELLEQEKNSVKPRSTVVSIIKKNMRKLQPKIVS